MKTLFHFSQFCFTAIVCMSMSGIYAQIATNQSTPVTSRLGTPGPAQINCTELYDSRCATQAALPAVLPICSVKVTPENVNLSLGGSATSTISATCSPGTTQYKWTASSGQIPTGISSTLTYSTAGSYCYAVAGKNPAVNLNFGSASASVCVVVSTTIAASCPANADYQEILPCSAGQTGNITRFWIYDNTSCNYSFVDSPSCAASPQSPVPPPQSPVCTGGKIWDGMACVCPAGQVINVQTGQCIPNAPPATTVVTVVLDRFGTEYVSFGGTQPYCNKWPQTTLLCTWNGSTLTCPGGKQSNGISITAAANALWPGPAPASALIEDKAERIIRGIGISCNIEVFNHWY